MTQQITNELMMIRPVAFQMNKQTAVNNYYQKEPIDLAERIQEQALEQFDAFVQLLRSEGVRVKVFEDTPEPLTPDSIFPNNWISCHEDGVIRLYPMFAENRRSERRGELIERLKDDFKISEIKNYTEWEQKGAYLEGTGSLILDRQNKIAYSALSERTKSEIVDEFCEETGFDKVMFDARQTVDGKRLPIYHTNVMMCLGEAFVAVCMESIDKLDDRQMLVESFKKTKKEIIEISEVQIEHFAGNMLQVIGANEERLIVMSSAAYHSLHEDQKLRLENHGRVVHSDIHTIEQLGGGSARCMMAEIFLPLK